MCECVLGAILPSKGLFYHLSFLREEKIDRLRLKTSFLITVIPIIRILCSDASVHTDVQVQHNEYVIQT